MADRGPAPARWARRLTAPLASRLIACGAGALLALAFAPWDLWPLAVLCPAVVMAQWRHALTPRDGALLGLSFGLGLFAAGTWWLYISIHVFGEAPLWVALFVMGTLVLIMAGWYALLGWFVVRHLGSQRTSTLMLGMPAAWLLVEWCRGWFLSGFPWLSLGYTQTGTWLVSLAPVGGTYLLSALLLLAAAALVALPSATRAGRIAALTVLLLPWALAFTLRGAEWTTPAGEPRSVAIVQGAIPQDMKWLASNRQQILDDYARLHEEALGAALIVWPESALPDLANLLPRYISEVWSKARSADSAVIMGVMRVTEQQGTGAEIYHNSMLALGDGEPAFYDKRHLVPFGEYFPVPDWVRNVLRLMSLPHSDFTAGAAGQGPLRVGGFAVSASICYEDAYPSTMRGANRASDLLVNVTNDAWFGRSGARYQHLQIARMRAAEAQRPLLRAANDGVSAVIGPHGEMEASAPEFKSAVLRSQVVARHGDTPYLVAGNWPIISAAALLLLLVGWRERNLPRRRSVYGKTGFPKE